MSQRTIQFDLSPESDTDFKDALVRLDEFKKAGWKVVDVKRDVQDGQPIGRIVVELKPAPATNPASPP